MPRPAAIGAFTLIELLVVVTIIVVLLALLTPALDKAIYQAELTQCGANHKGIASAVTQYAFDNKRWYPDRRVPNKRTVQRIDVRVDANTTASVNVGAIQPHKLADPTEGQDGAGSYDVRPKVKPYLLVNRMFNDPLSGKVDLDKPSVSNGAPDTHVFASIYLWFGWQYTLNNGARPLQGLHKVTDKLEAVTVSSPTAYRTKRFSMLSSDIDAYTNVAYSSHPDNDRLFNQVLQDVGPPDWPFGGFITVSQWRTNQGQYRGPLDLNHSFQDGSVRRTPAVEFAYGMADGMDRIANNYEGAGGWANVPRE